MMYVAVGNPFGDSTKRAGMNLFTDSIIALTLDTGRLKWHFQQTHHDVWDYDSGEPPILFDMQVGGRRVKALAEASKNGYLYILDRETGKPVHPIKEMPVPTDDAGPGQSPWPTQPIPFTASGKPMEPVCPDRAARNPGGAAGQEHDRADLLADAAEPDHGARHGRWHQLQPALLQSADRAALRRARSISRSTAAAGRKGYFSAYDPTTGELKWRQIFEGFGQAGLGRDRERSRLRRHRQQHRRLLLRLRRAQPASCCGSSTPDPASSRRRRSTWSTASSSSPWRRAAATADAAAAI